MEIMIVRHNGDMRTDLHAVADCDSSDRHGSKAVIDENIFAECHLTGEINLHRCEDADGFRLFPGKQIVKGFLLLIRQRFCCIETVQCSVCSVKFCNAWSVFFRMHVNCFTALQFFKNVHLFSPIYLHVQYIKDHEFLLSHISCEQGISN